jgi:hypothetical protein
MYLERRTEEGWKRKRAYTKSWSERMPVQKSLLYAARRRAKLSGIECTITEDDIVVPDRCPILDIPLERSKKKQQSSSPSLDRIDPSRGYVKGNVKVISYKANACKSNMTSQQIERLYQYVFGLERT